MKEGSNFKAIVDAITVALESYDPTTLKNVCCALIRVQASVLKHQGGKTFGIPHEHDKNVVQTKTMLEARYMNCRFVTCGRRILEIRKMG